MILGILCKYSSRTLLASSVAAVIFLYAITAPATATPSAINAAPAGVSPIAAKATSKAAVAVVAAPIADTTAMMPVTIAPKLPNAAAPPNARITFKNDPPYSIRKPKAEPILLAKDGSMSSNFLMDSAILSLNLVSSAIVPIAADQAFLILCHAPSTVKGRDSKSFLIFSLA